MAFRDPRLAGRGGARLIGILVEAFPRSGDAINRGAFAGLPNGKVQASTPWNEWFAVVEWADVEGRLQILVDALLDELERESRKIRHELALWSESRGVAHIADATPQILRAIESIASSPDPRAVEDQIQVLSQILADLVRRLADPRAPEVAFAGMVDSERAARRARDAARHASAAVDAFLVAVSSSSSLYVESASSNERDRADRLMAQGALMRHLLDQRIVVDAAVTGLLDALLAAFPTALDVTAHNPA